MVPISNFTKSIEKEAKHAGIEHSIYLNECKHTAYYIWHVNIQCCKRSEERRVGKEC